MALAAVALAASLQGAGAAGFGHEASPELPPPSAELLAEPNVAAALDPLYDRYLSWKEQLQGEYNIEYSLQLSLLPQWSAPKGGAAVLDFVWTPALIWKPFTDTGLGSGTFTFYAQQSHFWTASNTTTMQRRLGLLTPPDDWGGNTIDYAQLTYTHRLPGAWRWLSLSFGQYGFGLYDINQYAGNGQANFINYSLAQNATQTYGSADLGAWLEAAAPAGDVVLAGGFQGATNLTGSTIAAHGLASGKLAYFVAARWAPHFLAGGSYDILSYALPALPEDELPASHGFSFNAVQNLDSHWGLFLRANTATGLSSAIANSLAWGAVRNNPFGRDPLDQIGLGIARNTPNRAALGVPVRNAEWLVETYYNYTVFKGLQLGPDVQFYLDPALPPASGPVAVFLARATATF